MILDSFTGAYSFLNVFLLMLIWGGLMLDRFGIRLTGKNCCDFDGVRYGFAVLWHDSEYFDRSNVFRLQARCFYGSSRLFYFLSRSRSRRITVTKIIAKWFKGKELGTAMGIQVALARIGSQVAYSVSIPLAKSFSISTPVLLGLVLLVVGLVTFFYICCDGSKA